MSAEQTAGGMYASGTVLLGVALQLQAIRLAGDEILTVDDSLRLSVMAHQINNLAGELHSRGGRIARDHDVDNYPPEVEP